MEALWPAFEEEQTRLKGLSPNASHSGIATRDYTCRKNTHKGKSNGPRAEDTSQNNTGVFSPGATLPHRGHWTMSRDISRSRKCADTIGIQWGEARVAANDLMMHRAGSPTANHKHASNPVPHRKERAGLKHRQCQGWETALDNRSGHH